MKQRYAGFTLIELMIALVIFSLISGAAYRLFVSVSHSQQALESQLQQLADWQKVRLVLENDFSQLSPRPVRDEYGDQRSALILQPEVSFFVELTRAGWRNPLNQARSQLQRVAYQVKGGQLLRYYWPLLDRAPTIKAIPQQLMTGVETVRLRLLDREQRWHDQWPLTPTRQPKPIKAIEWMIEHREYGQRVILLPVPAGHIPEAGGDVG